MSSAQPTRTLTMNKQYVSVNHNRYALHWGVGTLLKYLKAFLIIVGVFSIVLVISGIWLLVEVGRDDTGSTKTAGNWFGSITLISGVLFMIMSWYGYSWSVRMNPYIQDLAKNILNQVPNGKIAQVSRQSAVNVNNMQAHRQMDRVAKTFKNNPAVAQKHLESHQDMVQAAKGQQNSAKPPDDSDEDSGVDDLFD